jgi:hypothetical protein
MGGGAVFHDNHVEVEAVARHDGPLDEPAAAATV